MQQPPLNKPHATGAKKVFRSFGYAFKGIGSAVASQLNIKVHLWVTLVTIVLGVTLGLSLNEWLWIGLCIALVLSGEMMNTAIELLTDLVSPEYNVKAGQVKDIAAGAVLILAIFAVVTGFVIFVPKILSLF
ncbi:diacylglycerol kinase family protein [Mucilaginibacter terrae]|uniref:Diacylglycerol kinase (ATP) n=1 Tax=Mucilaginibacter terrae TaxID=1955052 RepID=A0ABU3GVU6_9SPHI|nr:diacylglycerol kinase family protein [Mucilaginibacter terrae]MDT3403892.1 diacylglycerol kinase (ATP) [Mucilaginibacter terrae]